METTILELEGLGLERFEWLQTLGLMWFQWLKGFNWFRVRGWAFQGAYSLGRGA